MLLALTVQLAAGYALMALSLPLCRAAERRWRATPAALASLLVSVAALLTLPALVIPPLMHQGQQLAQTLPGLLSCLAAQLEGWGSRLARYGVDLTPVREQLLAQLGSMGGSVLAAAASAAGQAASALGKLVLAPLLAFYLLRDRRQIATALTLLAPVDRRADVVRAAREMRRETVLFLRGQLLLSLSVGVLTALGLWAVGTPAWLMLGLLMGVMELLPYAGPLLAGIPAVLLSLQGGLTPALWTLAVLVGVQQLEGNLLSPRLLSGAARLHPLAVLLLISAGGMLAGPWGMLAALPAAVAVRGALRGLRRA